MTQHVKQLRLESQYLTEQNRAESLESYTSTISHEFRTPLGTCLMFLEGLLKKDLPDSILRVLELIVSQLNLLLSLVNGVLDLKLLQEGKFTKQNTTFNPEDVFTFIT